MPEPPAEQNPTPEPVMRSDHHGSGIDHAAHEAKPKKRRKLFGVALLLLFVVALLIGFAPTLLSTGPGTALVVAVLNTQVDGEVAIDDLDLSWNGQLATGLSYTDSAKGLEARVASLDAGDVAFLGVLAGKMKLGDVTLSDTQVVVTACESRQEPVSEKTIAISDGKPFGLPAGLSGNLIINGLTVQYVAPEQEAVHLKMANGSIQMPDLRDITFNFRASLEQGTREGSIAFAGQVLNLFDPEGLEQANQAAYDVTFDVMDVPTAVVDQVVSGMSDAAEPGLLLALLGDGELVSRATVKGTLEQLQSDLEIKTPKLHVALDQLAQGNTLIASPKSTLRLDLDQAGFAALFPESGLSLVETTRIDLASLQMALPVVDQAVDWGKASASLVLKADDNLAVIDERGDKLWVNDLMITGNAESIADKLSFKLTTMLSAIDSESKVTREDVAVDLDIFEPLEATRRIDFFSEALPIRLADALLGLDNQLVLWLGETLSLQADMKGSLTADHKQGPQYLLQHYTLRPDGQITGKISGTYRKGRFTLATPTDEPVEAVLSPEAFASLMSMVSGREGEPALTIDKAMPVYVTLRDESRGPVSIATRQDKAGLTRFFPDPDRTTLAATIELTPARVFDPKLEKTYELRGGAVSLSVPDLRGKALVRAELDLWVRPDAGKEGVGALLTWQTTVTDLLDSEGSLPLDGQALMQQITAAGDMQLSNVPSGLMDSLLNRDGDLASILGPIVQSMDAGFTYKDGQPTGATVRLNWDEKNNQPMPDAWASMKPAAFDIDDQQMLTVRGGEDLELEIKVSEDFGDRWMGQLHPILFDAKSGDRPVKVKIDGKSFRFPLQGDKMLGSRVEASVDLGTIEFGDDALLGKLMQWTDRPDERAVFEPAKVKLVDGKISYDQFDLAVGKVKLRLDGEVDLVSGTIVDMAVRVPGDSLIRVFNELDGMIAKDDFLSIPMTGDIRKPTFDSSLIGREVARLVTRGLIEREKDKLGDTLGDLIKKGIGGDKDKSNNENPPNGNEPAPEQDPQEADPQKDVADELIERGLGLLFKRLGKDKDESK